MNRLLTIVGLTALTLALLVGCGKESKSGSPCRDEYVKLYEKVVKLLKDSAPGDPDIDAKMTKNLGNGVPKACPDPRLANKILQEVEGEFDAQLAELEGKWGADNISGFRDPMGAGHGPPIQH